MDSLPDEVIKLVCSCLSNPKDIVHFSACSRHLRQILPGKPLRMFIVGYNHGCALPEVFFVSEAPETRGPGKILQVEDSLYCGKLYHIWTYHKEYPFRLLLERHRRLTVDTPSGTKYADCPFDLGLRPWSPSQTWEIDHGSLSDRPPNTIVPWNTPIGLTVAGENRDNMQADGRVRRFLTVTGNVVRVLPSSWGKNERFQLVRAGRSLSPKYYSTKLYVNPIPDIREAGHTMVYSPTSLEVAPLAPVDFCTKVEFDFWTINGRMYVKSGEIPFALVIPIFAEDEIKEKTQVAPLRTLCERNSGRWFSFRLYVAYAADFICGSERPDNLIEIFMRDGKGHRDHTITCDSKREFATIECLGAVIDRNIQEYPRHPDQKPWYVCLT